MISTVRRVQLIAPATVTLLVAMAAVVTVAAVALRGPINPGQGAQLEWADLREVD